LLTHADVRGVHAHLIDLSAAALGQSVQALSALENLDLRVTAHQATYEDGLLALPTDDPHPTLLAFLGSNIGNFDPPGASAFLDLMRAAVRPRDYLLLGADLVKPERDLLLARLLDEHPNLNVDIAARLGELGRQPYTARAFFLRYADRILFGADLGPDPATYAVHYRFLETFDESFDYGTDPVPTQGRWQIHGIGLPDDVLRKVYRDNARRLFAMGPG